MVDSHCNLVPLTKKKVFSDSLKWLYDKSEV